MIEFPFIGGAYQGRSTNLNAQVCQNLYPVVGDKEGSKSVLALMGVPGMLLFCTSGKAAAVRGMGVWGDYLYAVVGNTLYMISSAGSATSKGTLSTSTGTVWMVGGTTHLCIVDGTKGYYKTFSDAGLSEITDVDFPVPTSLTYQDGYFIVTESGTDSFHISASEDASSWDGLDFASAEDTPDESVVIKSHNRELWIFGEDTTEIFYNSGDADFPFSRVSGGVLRIGCGAAASVVSEFGGIAWLDNHFRVQMSTGGYNVQAVSTPAIEYAFQQYATKSDAIAYGYTQEGHTFYVITFPTESRTWVYDITTGFWHTRVSGTGSGRHRGNAFAYFNGKNLVGDWQNGNIYELDLDTYTDVGGAYIVAKRACQAVHKGKARVFHNALELDMETGVGLVTGHGSDPQVCLEWSDDGGHTWSSEHWTGMGALGAYSTRARWSKLGSSRQRVYRVMIDDPVKRVIIGAYLDASEGAH